MSCGTKRRLNKDGVLCHFEEGLDEQTHELLSSGSIQTDEALI